MAIKNYEKVTEKFKKDYNSYVERVCSENPRKIFEDCYRHTIAAEWLCFFDIGGAEDFCDRLDDDVCASLLVRKNLVDDLMWHVHDYTDIELNCESFNDYFRQFLDEI